MTQIRYLVVLLGAFTVGCADTDPSTSTSSSEVALETDSDGSQTSMGSILRLDSRLDALVPTDAEIEKLSDGFIFIEGPVWRRSESRLLFSDVRGNSIYQWDGTGGVRPFIDPVFEGDRTGLRSISSNGLTLDAEGRLIICEHGNRRITRIETDGSRTTLVDSYEGRRLNSPNDATYGSDGSNGIALSPDESTLYVANSDPGPNHVWMAYDLSDNGVSNGRVFYDISDQDEPGAADGMKVDRAGHLFATGPGGVWIIAPDGTHLGTIVTPEVTANVGWGDDGRTLYMTSSTGLYRIGLSTDGVIPGP